MGLFKGISKFQFRVVKTKTLKILLLYVKKKNLKIQKSRVHLNPLNTMWHCHGYEAPIGWGKNRRNRKGERRIGEKIMFSLIYFKRENTKNIKQRERGNPPRPANCFLPIWEENLEENRRKEGLTSWITHLPPQSWRPIRDLFLKNLFIYGKLCVRTFFSFLLFFFFLLILSSMFF